MMKNPLIILLLVLGLAPARLLGQAAMQDLEATFGTEAYAAENLDLFEVRGKQKATDMMDYLDLLSDPQVATKLAEHTRGVLGKLFVSDTCRFYSKKAEGESVSIAEVRAGGKLPAFLPAESQSISILRMSPGLEAVGNGTFSGILHFSISEALSTSLAVQSEHTVEIRVVRIEKQFGRELRPVWEVYLCDVDAPWHLQ